MEIERIKEEIAERLLRLEKPFKVILFGSHASGSPSSESDIDLLVVLNKDKAPKNFKERSENYLKISRVLRDIERKIPLDIIVYTKPEFERFLQIGSLFSKTIMQEGKEIL